MNPGQMKRFAAPTTREAMQRVRAAFGDDAVVLSTKPCPEGIEVLAMPPEAVPREGGSRGKAPSVAQDVNTLAMSTLSFQDYVRERMLRRRSAEQQGQPDPVAAEAPAVRLNEDTQARARRAVAQMQALRAQRVEPTLDETPAPTRAPARASALPERPVLREPTHAAARWAAAGLGERPTQREPVQHDPILTQGRAAHAASQNQQATQATNARDAARERVRPAPALNRAPPVLREEVALPSAPVPDYGVQAARQVRESADIAQELRAMKGLIEARFGALAFMEKMQRQPQQAQLAQRLIAAGFSPAMVRKLVDACPSSFVQGADEQQWAQAVLARNLQVADVALEDRQGVFALIGSTGVGKTTTTAKIAANFAAKHGASQLGLITLDAYRIGAHEQLRGYGRILGVPVHTAHDRASLDDLLDLLANKQLILIDTAGMAQRDARTHELLDMLAHPAIRKLLVVNASAQGETNDEVVGAWRAAECEGVILSKLDEAVRLGPALDSLIRHRLRVQGLANGQRVPEDWLRLPADELMKLAFKPQAAGSPWRMDEQDLALMFAGGPADAMTAAH